MAINTHIFKEKVANWVAGGGQRVDRGMHGGAESCMWAAFNGHLHVLQRLREDDATRGVLRTRGYNYVIEWE
jgi:hypothetical protein